MNLAQAIRDGHDGLGQCKNRLFDTDKDGTFTGVCAIGSAIKSMVSDKNGMVSNIKDLVGTEAFRQLVFTFPILTKNAYHPVTNEYTLCQFIVEDLNDSCNWTFDQIAEWVESQEKLQVSND